MNEPYNKKIYDYEAEEMVERQRQRRLARIKRRQREKRKRILLLCAALLLLAILVFVLIPKGSQPLKGTWAYGETAELQFGKDRGKIVLHDTKTECAFSYTVEENTLHMDFDNAYLTDAAYTFTVDKGSLTLVGGDGTTGGTYALTRKED